MDKKQQLIQDLSQELANNPELPYAQEILTTLSKIFKANHSVSDLKIITHSLKELYQSFKVFSPYKDVRKVAIFGSARTKPEETEYQMAEELAGQISRQGFMIVTGAGPGIMEAGNKGAELNMSFGVNINLPFEQSSNPYIENSTKLVKYKYFFTRKLTFIRETDATVLFPGGYGTHDEGFETLTLIQNGRCAPRPIVLLADPKSNYWQKWQEFITEQLLKNQLISEYDLSLFTIANTVEQAVKEICLFYKNYHSIRYLPDVSILRLNYPVSKKILFELNQEFTDILFNGSFAYATPEQIKADSEEYPEKPRLAFNFNLYSYGRLHEMIRFLNSIQ